MEIYTLFFAAILPMVVLGGYWLYKQQASERPERSTSNETDEKEESDEKSEPDTISLARAALFQKIYFGVYTLVLAADWLQGPYFYSLYRYSHGLPEATVAQLFTTGFVSAGISASFVGALADRYGRRNACLAYCGIYSVSCLSVLSSNLPILFFGRILGGISSTLLYSVFEAWMVSEHHSRNLSSALPLGTMFSWSVTLSGTVAIVSGVVGEVLVSFTGTKTSPFMLAIVCLATAAAGIHTFWGENYGKDVSGAQDDSDEAQTLVHLQPQLPTQHRQQILALGLVTTVFEGSMYLFVFMWTPALESARTTARITSPSLQETLPFGLIFASFMCAMMLGSMVVSTIDIKLKSLPPVVLLIDVIAVAASALLIPVLATSEISLFWSFAAFEACVGMYFPTIAKIKSKVVHDSVRAKVYAWMRLPLNVFVVVALGLKKEGTCCIPFPSFSSSPKTGLT